MAASRLIDMGPGPDQYRASLLFSGWPSITAQSAWDATHARALHNFADASSSLHRSAIRLAGQLALSASADDKSPVPTSMASVRRRYAIAENIGAGLAHLCDRLEEPAHFWTVIPGYGEVLDPGDISAAWMRERLRNDLNDRGALGSDGILFAVLEAEYQMCTGLWRFHWHGVASGGKLRAIDCLRGLAAYHTSRRQAGEPKAAVSYRVKVARRPLFDLPKPITYCIKPWNARWEDELGERGRRRRMPLEAIPKMLLWQDRSPLRETALLMGLRHNRNGFTVLGGTAMR